MKNDLFSVQVPTWNSLSQDDQIFIMLHEAGHRIHYHRMVAGGSPPANPLLDLDPTPGVQVMIMRFENYAAVRGENLRVLIQSLISLGLPLSVNVDVLVHYGIQSRG